MNLYYTQLLRIILIIMVIIIHTTYVGQKNFSEHLSLLSLDFFYVFLNQFSRFSVPLFVMISGYGLASKYSKEQIDIKEFYKARFLKIGIPFVVWTIIFFLIKEEFRIDLEFIQKLFYYFTITGVDYHFYFFIIILQCYLVFPILIKKNSKFLLAILFLLQIYNYFPTDRIVTFLGFSYISFPSTFIFSWLFYFYSGIFIKKNEIIIVSKFQKYILYFIFIFFLGLLWMVLEYLYFSYNKIPFYYFDHFHRYSVLIYSLSFFNIYFLCAKFLENKTKSIEVINRLGNVTFSVYIFHTTLLRILDIYIMEYILLKTIVLIIILFLFFYYIKIYIENLIIKNNNKYIIFIKLIKLIIGI